MSFNVALTGLNAATQALAVTSRTTSPTRPPSASRARAPSSVISTPRRRPECRRPPWATAPRYRKWPRSSARGNVETTGNSLDLAINGNGFFTISNGGALSYTRDGEFQVNNAGQVVTSTGGALQVYAPLPTGGFNTGGLSNLTLTTNESAPQATANASITATLPADASPPATTTFSPSDPTSYTETTSMTVYDSLGAAHTASLYFIKGAAANDWSEQTYIDGNPVGTPQDLQYSTSGALTNPANGQVTLPAYTPATGAADMNMTFNFNQTQQTGDTFAVTAVQQDGFTTGTLTGINIDSAGVVQASFTNGRSVALGQIAMANFANTQGLQQNGNATWTSTTASGSVVQGVAGGSGFGSIQSGALEESNVDTTSALVDMITAQRDFQANAQMIQTQDQITQTVITVTQSG